MPGTPVRVDEPNQRPVPADEEVRRNPEMGNFGVVRVFRGVQGVGEELLDAGAAEPRRRQTDGVHHDEADRLARGAIVVVGRAEGAAKERGGHSPMLAGQARPTRPRLNENAPAGPGRWGAARREASAQCPSLIPLLGLRCPARVALAGAKGDEARGHCIQNHHLHDRVIGRVAHVDVPILGALAHDGFVAEAQLQNVVLRMVQGPHDSDSHAKWCITVLITTESPRTAATHTRLSSRPSKPRAIQTWDASLYRTAPDSTSSPIKASSSPRSIILRRAWSVRTMGRSNRLLYKPEPSSLFAASIASPTPILSQVEQ